MQRAMSRLRVAVDGRRHCGTATCVHVPAASQTSSVQACPSLVHAVPAGASRQRAEQQSPPTASPSPQFSEGSTTPFPHLLRCTGPPSREQVLEWKVPVISSPSPVPLY